MGRNPATSAAALSSAVVRASTNTSAAPTEVSRGASKRDAAAPVVAQLSLCWFQIRPVSANPVMMSDHVTPTLKLRFGGLAAAADAYASSKRSKSTMWRAESRPRSATAPSSPRSLSTRSAVVQLALERPVASPTPATVALAPQSSASETASTEGVHRACFCGASSGCPVRETMIGPMTNSAAPVSSSQPIPAFDSASLAPGEIRRATTRSGRRRRSATTGRTSRSQPSPTHLACTGMPLTRKSAAGPGPAGFTLTERGSTARTADSTRLVTSRAPIPSVIWYTSHLEYTSL